jgi:hypothetical protein
MEAKVLIIKGNVVIFLVKVAIKKVLKKHKKIAKTPVATSVFGCHTPTVLAYDS